MSVSCSVIPVNHAAVSRSARSRAALKAAAVAAVVVADVPAYGCPSKARAVVLFTRYVATFESDSPANQITLGTADVESMSCDE